jgi:ATP-dependent helicase/nuclease subunit A
MANPEFASEIHPLVARMNVNAEQMPAVVQRGSDVVVTAGAGTGKTRTLVARYLALLADGLPLGSVVAITFTRKAAREMRSRVRREVRQYLAHLSPARPEREMWLAAYTGLDSARIGTIHSLCSEILRAHPAQAGIDPMFSVLEENQATLMRQRVVEETMALAASDEATVALFALLGEVQLRGTLADMLERRLDTRSALRATGLEPWGAWTQQLAGEIAPFIDSPEVGRAFDDLEALRDEGVLARAEAAGDALAPHVTRLVELWEQMKAERSAGEWWQIVSRLQDLRADMKLKGRAENWRPAKPKELIRFLRIRYDTAVGGWLGCGVSAELDRDLARGIPALSDLFDRMVGTYTREKEEARGLDFDDLEAKTVRLLKTNRSVLQYWRCRVRAMLVDEFQDTNGRQRDIVQLLNGKQGKVFIVGDAKQSIYRFRGADVTVFREERERIADRGEAFHLSTSYRAHRALVTALNDLLRPVLGSEAVAEAPWIEPFAPLVAARDAPRPGFSSPYVEVHLALGSKVSGALDRAADAVGQRIFELTAKGKVETHTDAHVRPLVYGDFAILCRSSASFGAYEDGLARAGIPYVTVAGRGFLDRPEVRDLANAVQAIADPTDDLAMAGLLRSPAFGLTDAAVYWLRERQRERDEPISLWDAMQNSVLPKERDRQVVARAVSVVGRLHAEVGRAAVGDVIKSFLDLTHYRASCLRAGQVRAARNVSKLLDQARRSRTVSVSDFLDLLAASRDSGVREGEARVTAEGAVQIMSIHAAKGLEFPVVIVGDVTHQASRPAKTLADPDLGVVIPLRSAGGEVPVVHALAKRREEAQEAAESDRLFYVATTRAREMLILNGCVGVSKDGSLRNLGGWLEKTQILADTSVPEMDLGSEYDDFSAVPFDCPVRGGVVTCALYGRQWTPSEGSRPTGTDGNEVDELPSPRLLEVPIVGGQRESDTH